MNVFYKIIFLEFTHKLILLAFLKELFMSKPVNVIIFLIPLFLAFLTALIIFLDLPLDDIKIIQSSF